ncbi:kelch repeat-containing protein [Planctomycetota bacterium]
MKTNNRFKKIIITFVVIGMVTTILLTSATSARAATWTQKTDMPTARWNLTTSVVDGKIYAIGGVGGFKKVEEYDPATDTWTEKADMPTGRVFLASSVVDGKIYVIGGYNFWGGAALAAVEEYDPATDTWTKKADMPAPRGALGTSVVNGKVYVIGGNGKGDVTLAMVEEYDPATDTWTRKADMPTARLFVNTSVVNGKIYAIGGITEYAWPAFPTVEEYDPVTDMWVKKADMPVPRAAPTSVVDEKIYAFGGGARKGGTSLSTLFQYDPATDIWTAKDDMPVRMGGMGTSVVGGRIYIIGGSSAPYPFSPYLSTVWEYDTGLGVPSPDFNGDGVVDSADISIMVDHWHMDNPLYDIAPAHFGDGIVDVQDLIALSEHLFEEVNDPTLVAHWALDEAEGILAADSVSENGYNDGIVIGDPVWQPTGGQVKGAIQMDGVDDYMSTPFVLNPGKGSVSALAWIKGGAPGQVIISQPGDFGGTWIGTNPSDGKLMTGFSDMFFGALVSETVITDGQWHHVGFVYDLDSLHRRLYVDGAQVAEDVTVVSGMPSDDGLFIGTNKTLDKGTYFSGLIDDVRIYNRVVSP